MFAASMILRRLLALGHICPVTPCVSMGCYSEMLLPSHLTTKYYNYSKILLFQVWTLGAGYTKVLVSKKLLLYLQCIHYDTDWEYLHPYTPIQLSCCKDLTSSRIIMHMYM